MSLSNGDTANPVSELGKGADTRNGLGHIHQNGHEENGLDLSNGKLDGTLNGGIPELPHITNNILPLSNVIKFYSQETYKQLNTIIENLSITSDKDSDVVRKRKFLNVIISLRQDFIKLYTLVKWASKSPQVNKLIDLLNWFRTQEFYFDQLSLGLNELNGFSGAKLPNSDLITSLEVMIKGRPQLPSYNLIRPNPKLSPEKILSVLQELNLLLTTRLALTDNIPQLFLKNHDIKDGRIIFHLPKKFEVSITVGNDLIIDSNNEDYLKSPYFFIDFKFLFGINPETGILQTDISTDLPVDAFWYKLEKQCNSILLADNLPGLYKFLIRFSEIFKFKLIYNEQLKQLNRLKWSNIKYKLINNNSKITINYWGNENFIELLIDDNFQLVINWFKNNKLMEFNDLIVDDDRLNIENVLNSILNKHCELLMDKIYQKNPKILKLINPYQILIKLTSNKFTILSIDSLTGKFYFIDPNSVEFQILRKINTFNPTETNEDDESFISYINTQLIELKLLTIAKEIHNKLVTIEWINNKIITLKNDELTKLNIDNKFKIQYFRCKNWPSSWFLINVIDDKNFDINWYVSRIKSIKGDWKLEWVSNLSLKNSLNFKFFNNLSLLCSNKIIDNMISQELVHKNIEFMELKPDNEILTQYLPTQEEKKPIDTDNNGGYELILLVFNGKSRYLPIQNSSNSFILKFELINNKESKLIKIKLISKLNLNLPQLRQVHLQNLTVNESQNCFEINKEINLVNFGMNFNTTNINLLSDIFDTLYKFNRLISLMNELMENKIDVLEYDDFFKIKVNDYFKELYIGLPPSNDNGDSVFYFKYNPDEQNTIKLIINYVNKCLCYAGRPYTILNVINYLNQITPIMESISHLSKFLNEANKFKLPNGLNKLNLDLKFINLNNFELLFSLNYFTNNNTKKIQKDKIILNLKFKLNKFKINNNLDLIISLIDNINIKNLKYKKLFELIFKTLNGNDNLINLNYDFIINLSVIDEFLLEIGKCFLDYVEHEI